ncbi:MAG: BrnT family toxin [Anaerolineae bacterium]|nr:BrnT family toxin [Anaerolineae bacterium]
MRYEWDENKRQLNLHKHGFDFEDAYEVFNSPLLIQLDTRQDYGEDRWVAIGFLRYRVVVIVYAENDERDVRRIISLRKALSYEQKRFEEYLADRLG